MAIDRWREDILDATSRAWRRADAAFDEEDLVGVIKDMTVLVEDLVAEVSRLRVMLRERGIEDRETITG